MGATHAFLGSHVQMLGADLKELFVKGLQCGCGGQNKPNNSAASIGSSYEAPVSAPMFSGSSAGGYMPPDNGDGPLLS